MINMIWFLMLLAGIVTAALSGNIEIVTKASIAGAEQAVVVALGLIGIVALWSGLMRIAQDAGLMEFFARVMHPFVRLLFPDVPKDHPAIGAILLAFSANLLGLGNACTPLGLKAMDELQKLNLHKERASDSMCTFVITTSSSLTIIPGTIIGLRVAAGSTNPTAIIGTTIVATTASTIAAILADRILRKFF